MLLGKRRDTAEWICGHQVDQYRPNGRITFHASWPQDWTMWYTELSDRVPHVGHPDYSDILLEYLEHRRQANVLAEVMYEL